MDLMLRRPKYLAKSQLFWPSVRHFPKVSLHLLNVIDIEHLILVPNPVARESHHALDEIVFLMGRNKHHRITASRFADLKDFGPNNRQPNTIGKLIDQNKVTDLKCWNHGA